jgi:hypothetical protein
MGREMSDQSGSAPAVAGLFQLGVKAVTEGQAAYAIIAALFIASISTLLPNPTFLTQAFVVQCLYINSVALILALVTLLFAQIAAERSFDPAIDHVFKKVLARGNLGRALPTMLLISLFISCFPSFKSHIPNLNPFKWDDSLAAFDRWLHFGTAPWEILSSVTGYGLFSVFIDKVYYFWFPVTFVSAAAVALSPGNGVLRHRFLIAFALLWILVGCLAAMMMSSAGPIFYDRLYGGPSEFSPLLTQLSAVNQYSPLRSIAISDMLWTAYLDQSGALIGGISAMPSMHNAICVLLFLAARHVHRWLAAAAALYGLAIFIGSVHLGWHYAADAYLAAALTALIWKAAGYIADAEAKRIQPA